jgi:hypothetical protein
MQKSVEAMLASHPRPIEANRRDLAACIEACLACDQACSACADACLGEKDVLNLLQCIRLNLDCADVCAITGRLLSRQTLSPGGLLRDQIQVCAQACDLCAAECEKHAHHHEHCRVCMEACRRCAEACRTLLVAVPRT